MSDGQTQAKTMGKQGGRRCSEKMTGVLDYRRIMGSYELKFSHLNQIYI